MIVFDFVLEIFRALLYVFVLNNPSNSIMGIVLVVGIFHLFVSIVYVFISVLYIILAFDPKVQVKINKYFHVLDKYKFIYYLILIMRVVFIMAFAYKEYLAIALMLMFEEIFTWLGKYILRQAAK